MSISASSSGSFESAEDWLKKMSEGTSIYSSLARYGDMGVAALAAVTPSKSGVTANSWYYEIIEEKGTWSIVWGNSNVVDGRPIAILLEYGHGTGTGGYVAPRPFINSALQPVIDQAVAEGWKLVSQA